MGVKQILETECGVLQSIGSILGNLLPFNLSTRNLNWLFSSYKAN